MSPPLSKIGCLPFFAQGLVTRGFGRGSKSLGIPTANFSDDVVKCIPDAMENGVYYGLANIDGGPISKMVLSVGHNPHFNNQCRTMETHILRHFDADFYGSWMRVGVLGFIRTMQSYSSLDELIAAIHSDIAVAEKELDRPEMMLFRQHAFFQQDLPKLPIPEGSDNATLGNTSQNSIGWSSPTIKNLAVVSSDDIDLDSNGAS